MDVDALVTHHHADVGGIRLHYVAAGPHDGPLVVLLHGFPEFWYSWRFQLPALAAAGFRAVAPDLRGYNESDKPAGVESYGAEALTGDVAGLVAACGRERCVLVGHDWGGVVAWLTAARRPDVIERLIILNAPHPARFSQALRTPMQWVRSSYIAFFQLPALPEALLSAANYAPIRAALRALSLRDGAFADADLTRYAEAFAQPGAVRGALAYYRAMGRAMTRGLRRPGGARRSAAVRAPTLVIWGAGDVVLPASLADPGRRLVPDCRVELVDGAGHFVQADAPERVNELLVDFLTPST